MAAAETKPEPEERHNAAVKKHVVPDEYKDSIEKLQDTKPSCKEFYQIQSQHQLGEECDRKKVAIWFSQSDSDPKPDGETKYKDVHNDWIPHLQNAIEDINNAAPGLHLYRCDEKATAHVIIYGTKECASAYTINRNTKSALICLSDDWDGKKYAICHELLHAILFQHEQKRGDGNKFMNFSTKVDSQSKPCDDVFGITRFDPFSIMLYDEGHDTFTRDADGDEVWKLKEGKELNVEMSELDKVGLNIIFRPCVGPNYKPKKKSSNGLWYCGREGSTDRHNWPKKKATDGKCGPNRNPNCPACRVLKNPFLEEIWKEDKWQGWSGFVYCGRYFGKQEDGHDGYCGPNEGPQCKECEKYMNK